MEFSTIPPSSLERASLKAEFYGRDFRAASELLRQQPTRMTLEQIRSSQNPIRRGIDMPQFVNTNDSPILVTIASFSDPGISFANLERIDKGQHQKFHGSQLKVGDLLVAMGGYVGAAAIVPPNCPDANIGRHTARIVIDSKKADKYFVWSYIRSSIGTRLFEREVTGSVQAGINLEDLRDIEIPMPRDLVQMYIGNKVRQAERLRRAASQLKEKQSALISIPVIESLLVTHDDVTNRVQPKTFSADRFDPKYYSKKSLALVESISQSGGVHISGLCDSMTNGFESRDFQLSGTPYLTVSEISSGRVDIASAPKISAAIEIPIKARATRNCVLVVRGGSVGIAAKVFEWDESAAISSDLIRLEFASEDVAAAVAAFLGSDCGALLMKRASYGAVMPKLGQEELASILIPNSILKQGAVLNELMKQTEQCIRLSRNLINSAKRLVEALIERKVAEDELVHAQTRLEQGEDSADRAILSRLFEGGWDAKETRPLFPDLDAYYETLRIVERDQMEVAAK